MTDETLEHAINDMIGGAAICFLGAGFSLGAEDSDGRPVPRATDLCREIFEITDMQYDPDVSLKDIAEYCDNNELWKQGLKDLLTRRLTLCKPQNFHVNILRMPWRSVFTTNFDDVAENALKEQNPIVVTPVFDVKHLEPKTMPLYYLHGRALDILRGAADPNIVLTDSNYLTLREKNHDLFSALENEVYAARRIFLLVILFKMQK